MSVRVLLADDHTMLREGLRRSLELEGFEIVGVASDGLEAVHLVEDVDPDIVLMDVTMPTLDGVGAVRMLRERGARAQVVMLTMHDDNDLLVDAMRAGAAGYLVKDCSTSDITSTIRKALYGSEAPDIEAEPVLSAREEEVLQMIADGASTTEAAERLYISVKTVKNHLASIYQKLDARDRTQAVLRAARLGIVRLA